LHAITLPSYNSPKPIATLYSSLITGFLGFLPRRSATSLQAETRRVPATPKRLRDQRENSLVPVWRRCGRLCFLTRGTLCRPAGRRTRTSLPRIPGTRNASELRATVQSGIAFSTMAKIAPRDLSPTCKPEVDDLSGPHHPDAAVPLPRLTAKPGHQSHLRASAFARSRAVSAFSSLAGEYQRLGAWQSESRSEIVRLTAGGTNQLALLPRLTANRKMRKS
jgi:hypothetical protein